MPSQLKFASLKLNRLSNLKLRFFKFSEERPCHSENEFYHPEAGFPFHAFPHR